MAGMRTIDDNDSWNFKNPIVCDNTLTTTAPVTAPAINTNLINTPSGQLTISVPSGGLVCTLGVGQALRVTSVVVSNVTTVAGNMNMGANNGNVTINALGDITLTAGSKVRTNTLTTSTVTTDGTNLVVSSDTGTLTLTSPVSIAINAPVVTIPNYIPPADEATYTVTFTWTGIWAAARQTTGYFARDGKLVVLSGTGTTGTISQAGGAHLLSQANPIPADCIPINAIRIPMFILSNNVWGMGSLRYSAGQLEIMESPLAVGNNVGWSATTGQGGFLEINASWRTA
jgi:hypothetical protein